LWQHARVSGLPVSVMLIDIDHFKAYNDHYGHPAGDRCLKEVTAAIAGAARRRPLDVVARYGGEEIILVGSDRAEATQAAAKVLRAVTELGIAHEGAGTRSYLTVSVGITSVASGGKYAHEDAVLLADIALYSAKRRGRNAWWYHSEADEGGGAGDAHAEATPGGLLRDAV
jgi:diguanylate cyclase (GGDEF)-like protein